MTRTVTELLYDINIYFAALAEEFTEQAKEEYDQIKSFDSFRHNDVKVNLKYLVYFVDDLMEAKWRQQNTQWKNKKGKKQEGIPITVVAGKDGVLKNSKWCAFFGKAVDLVRAYKDLGYQIFEPNVRCELRNSRINRAIRDSIMTTKGRKEFKHLNNGITIMCDTFTKPSANRNRINIIHPGIINGLQTVKSLHDAYMDMESTAQLEFEDVCEVLIRVHMKNSVSDINELIKATNNQNPMQIRNLKSRALLK